MIPHSSAEGLGYIRTLELALTWLFQQNPKVEHVLNRKLAREGSASILVARDSKESNKLHKSWRRSKFCKDVDKLLSGEQINPNDEPSPGTDDDNDDESDGDGEITGQLPRLSSVPLVHQHLSGNLLLSPRLGLSIQDSPRMCPSLEAASPHRTCLVELTPLPADSWRLFEIYFAYTQSWFPICEKSDILRLSYSYPDEGINLKTTLPDSDHHAELWSVLAVAAHQASLDRLDTTSLSDIGKMYDIARSLVPNESGSFRAGHVKAFLNLAVINIGQGKSQNAWILVGSACRLLSVMEQSQVSNSRWEHVVAGCFLLDGLLSLPLLSRPYLRQSDVNTLPEDGLEEWQPWSGPLKTSATPLSKTPVMGISSFNKLIEIVDALASSRRNMEQSAIQLLPRITSWKASLPAKFNYISSSARAAPPNPPALLLQVTYYSSLFLLHLSTEHVASILEILEKFHGQLGLSAIPPVVLCLIENIQMSSAYLTVEQQTRVRLQDIVARIKRAWGAASQDTLAAIPLPLQAGLRAPLVDRVPASESMQAMYSEFTPRSNRSTDDHYRATTSLLEDILPDMDSTISSTKESGNLPEFNLARTELRRNQSQQQATTASRDLEMFFDELASLDGAEKVDNQPQFMQNLGFAPDANMADFFAVEFSQILPQVPPSFMPEDTDDRPRLHPEYFGTT